MALRIEKARDLALEGRVEELKCLAEADIRCISAANERGEQPLHLACLRDHAECCELLLSFGASLTAVDNYGNSPLHVAAMAGSMQCLRLCLTHVADFEVTNKRGETPLDVAKRHEQQLCVNFLGHAVSESKSMRAERLRQELSALHVEQQKWCQIFSYPPRSADGSQGEMVHIFPADLCTELVPPTVVEELAVEYRARGFVRHITHEAVERAAQEM